MVNFPLDSFFTAVGQNGSGTATAGFKFGGDLNGINFYANTQVKNVHIAGLVFPEAHGKIDMSGSVLHLTDYRVAMEQGYNLINGMVDIGGAEPCGKRNRKYQRHPRGTSGGSCCARC